MELIFDIFLYIIAIGLIWMVALIPILAVFYSVAALKFDDLDIRNIKFTKFGKIVFCFLILPAIPMFSLVFLFCLGIEFAVTIILRFTVKDMGGKLFLLDTAKEMWSDLRKNW